MKDNLKNNVRISLDNLEGELEHIQDMFGAKLQMMEDYVDKYVK